MKIQKLHSWDISPKEAANVQRELLSKISLKPLKGKVRYVAGADVSYSRGDPRLFAAVVVLKLPELEVVEVKTYMGEATFPYISGFLAFREIPVLLEVFRELKTVPDVVLCDGQGIAHPRRMGLASHLGLWLNVPTIGCAKTRLVGEYEMPREEKGSWSELVDRDECVGVVLRTRKKVKPIFVSPGHLIDLESSVRVVKSCVGRYRIPEPTRLAHIEVNRARSALECGEISPLWYHSDTLTTDT